PLPTFHPFLSSSLLPLLSSPPSPLLLLFSPHLLFSLSPPLLSPSPSPLSLSLPLSTLSFSSAWAFSNTSAQHYSRRLGCQFNYSSSVRVIHRAAVEVH